MATIGGSKSESDEEQVLFTNTDNPLKDTAVTSLELKVRLRKKEVTSCVTKISDAVKIITKTATGGSLSGNNLVVTGYITTGAGLIEKSRHAFDKLEIQVGKLEFVYEQVEIQFPGKFTDDVNDKLNKLEDGLQMYRSNLEAPEPYKGDEYSTQAYMEGLGLFKHDKFFFACGTYGSMGDSYTIR